MEPSSAIVPPRIIIGGETEYGIAVYSGGAPLNEVHNLWAIGNMLDAAHGVFTSLFEGGRESLRDLADHDRAEERLRELDAERESDAAPAERGVRQRFGFTGVMLPNGARFYEDMAHPEYSTPETTTPFEILLAQKHGDIIVNRCREEAERFLRIKTGLPDLSIMLVRNNSDYKGASYAGHENYSLSPATFSRICGKDDLFGGDILEDEYARAAVLFFVVRQVITGAGKVGGDEGHYPTLYQISQRADYIQGVRTRSTTGGRGIINRRDLPYADDSIFRRLHLIVGDSSVSDLSIYLKFGMTALFLMMLDSGFLEKKAPQILFAELRDSVRSYHSVSRDLTLEKTLSFVEHDAATPLELLHEYAGLAEAFVAEHGMGEAWGDVVLKWKGVLDGFSGDPENHPLSRSLDWVAKKRLLSVLGETYKKKEGKLPKEAFFQGIELRYHTIDPAHSLAKALERKGKMVKIADDAAVESTFGAPPETTRAWLRGEIVRRYAPQIRELRWDTVALMNDNGEVVFLSLADPFWGSRTDAAGFLFDNPPLPIFLERVKEKLRAARDRTKPHLRGLFKLRIRERE